MTIENLIIQKIWFTRVRDAYFMSDEDRYSAYWTVLEIQKKIDECNKE